MIDDDVQRHEIGIVNHHVWYAYYITMQKSMDLRSTNPDNENIGW